MSIEKYRKYRKHCSDLVRIRSLLDDADGSLDDVDGSPEALTEAQRLSWEHAWARWSFVTEAATASRSGDATTTPAARSPRPSR